MADPIALKFVSRLIHPAIVTGIMAVLVAVANPPAVLPLACTTTWTMVGRSIIFMPDCSHSSPPAGASPTAPPPAPQQPPGPN